MPVGGGLQAAGNATAPLPSPAPPQQFHLAPEGASWCDFGVTPAEDVCFAAGAMALQDVGAVPTRPLFATSDTTHPNGCSVLSTGDDDWQVHFNRAGGANVGGYSLVCTGRAHPIRVGGSKDLSTFGGSATPKPP